MPAHGSFDPSWESSVGISLNAFFFKPALQLSGWTSCSGIFGLTRSALSLAETEHVDFLESYIHLVINSITKNVFGLFRNFGNRVPALSSRGSSCSFCSAGRPRMPLALAMVIESHLLMPVTDLKLRFRDTIRVFITFRRNFALASHCRQTWLCWFVIHGSRLLKILLLLLLLCDVAMLVQLMHSSCKYAQSFRAHSQSSA